MGQTDGQTEDRCIALNAGRDQRNKADTIIIILKKYVNMQIAYPNNKPNPKSKSLSTVIVNRSMSTLSLKLLFHELRPLQVDYDILTQCHNVFGYTTTKLLAPPVV